MGPFGLVVTGPHSSESLRARVVGARENERAAWRTWIAMQKRVICSVDECHAVDVVHITMFPVAMVEIVLWHGRFRAIEDRRLVHVVPDKGVRRGTGKGLVSEQRAPPFNGSWVKAVNPVGRARPAPAFIDVVVFVLDCEGFGLEFIDHMVITFILDMGIDDSD